MTPPGTALPASVSVVPHTVCAGPASGTSGVLVTTSDALLGVVHPGPVVVHVSVDAVLAGTVTVASGRVALPRNLVSPRARASATNAVLTRQTSHHRLLSTSPSPPPRRLAQSLGCFQTARWARTL